MNSIDDIYSKFGELEVLVVADICLDRDAVGGYTGYSREVETSPIFTVTTEFLRPGGGGNLAANLAHLGVKTKVVGTWGNATDRNRVALECGMVRMGINTTGMVVSGRTPVFEKYYRHNGDPAGRYDLAGTAPNRNIVQSIVSNISRMSSGVDYCIVADYDELGNGVCTPEVITAVKQLDIPTFGTSRTKSRYFSEFNWIVINNVEFQRQFDGNIINVYKAVDNAVITGGGEGATLYRAGSDPIQFPAKAPGEVVDICGCGDTFLAIFSSAVISGMNSSEAMELAIMGAGIVATKGFGVAYPSRMELDRLIGGYYG